MQEGAEITGALLLDCSRELLRRRFGVLGTCDRAEDADRRRLMWSVSKAREHEGKTRVFTGLVVHEHSALADFGDLGNAGVALVVHGDALLEIGAKPDRLTLLQRDQHVGPLLLARHLFERTVVEDVAVLVDLDERSAV